MHVYVLSHPESHKEIPRQVFVTIGIRIAEVLHFAQLLQPTHTE